ncbi:hypothetical protein ACA910_005454 [Epithemia clementina (nom. ined.)]
MSPIVFFQKRADQQEAELPCSSVKSGATYTTKERSWFHYYSELKKYQRNNQESKHSSSGATTTTVSRLDPTLAAWLDQQRVYYKQYREKQTKSSNKKAKHYIGQSPSSSASASSSEDEESSFMSAERAALLEQLDSSLFWPQKEQKENPFSMSRLPQKVREEPTRVAQATRKTTSSTQEEKHHLKQQDQLGQKENNKRTLMTGGMTANKSPVRSVDSAQENDAKDDEEDEQQHLDDAVWMERYRELAAYFQKHGTSLLPAQYPENPKLLQWADTQRVQYKLFTLQKKPCSLTKERVEMLNAIGFKWKLVESWIGRFRELEDYVQEHGNALVPQNYAPNPTLGIWVRNQRTQYKLWKQGKPSKLCTEHVKMLESLNFEWNANDAKWMASFVELGLFMRQHGLGAVPSYTQNQRLRFWVEEQRKQHRMTTSRAPIPAVLQPKSEQEEGQKPESISPLQPKRVISQKRIDLLDLVAFPWR